MNTSLSDDSHTDLEKSGAHTHASPIETTSVEKLSVWQRLISMGVELRGVEPVPVEQRTDTNPITILSVWSTIGLTLLAVTTGIVGTYYQGLDLMSASLVILFFTLLAAIPPAAFGILGPQTGMRQIVQTRYSFGPYAITIVAFFNLATTIGWTTVSAVVAGQTLSAVSGGGLSWNLGIVIASLICLFIAFTGIRVVHVYERWAWIPALIAILIAVGCGGHLLKDQAPTEPVTGAKIMSWACTVTSFTITWAAMVSDFSVYLRPDVSKVKMFTYIYAGLTVPVIPLLVLGAAIGGAIPSHPALEEAFATGSTGGAMMEMMRPAGDFRKFVAIILGFTVLGNMAGTMYSISCQFQLLLPFFARVPRWIFAVLTTGIIIAVAIPVSRTLLLSLENFLGVISYWGAIFVGIFATEHYYFRRGNAASYDPAIWNDPKRLPLGAAAFASSALPFALIVPCMSQSWFQGPIAKTTGDIGFEVALVLSPIFYLVFRTLELKWTGR